MNAGQPAAEGAAAPITILIVEDHRVVAEGLACLLGEYADLTVVASVESVGEAAGAAERTSPDVALIDFRLTDGTGADAADAIRGGSPSTNVLFLSADCSDDAMLAAVEAGAYGYLLKTAACCDEIAEAVRKAAAGEILIPADRLAELLTRRRMNESASAEQARRLESLTSREREVLLLLARGLDNRSVAAELNISYATVRTHVRNILDKLGVRSQLEAVARAVDWGLRV
jgi:two-component system response regulator DevR